MSNVIVQMSMSLDGYIAGPNDSDANGLGDGGDRRAGACKGHGVRPRHAPPVPDRAADAAV